MDLTVKTPPTVTSIDVALVRANKRIRHANEDALIEFWIKAADAYIEKRTNRALMRQTLVLRLSRVLPCVYLPRPPFAEMTHVKYTVEGDAVVTVAPGDYVRTTDRMLQRIEIGALGGYDQAGTMEIEYLVGAAAVDAVPAPLRQASLLLASHYTTSREAAYMDPRLMNVEKKIVFGVDELVKEYRVPNGTSVNDGW
jgi:uncharacterized phiE125 gp8 family phage protein